MSTDLVTLPATATVVDAAFEMRDRGIGDVVVVDDGRLLGLLTDRDIAVRVVAAGRNSALTPVADVCSREEIATVSPEDRVSRAVTVMRERAVRRLPVMKDGRPVGIVSLGDLALERDRRSALGEISAAPANR
jgi:CBS domain-containing protein